MFSHKYLKNLGSIKNIVLKKRFLHDCLKLEISGESVQFPHVWLRDNCQCAQCFHQTAKSRIIDWSTFDLNTKPKHIQQDANSITVTWTDDHTSVYKLNWLKFRSFTKENQLKYKEVIYRPTKKTWNKKNFEEIFTSHDYNSILNSDQALYNWLYNLAVYGVALIQNTPNSENAIDGILARVAFSKRTQYGVKFVIQNKPNVNHVAFLTSNLQMHTDLTYYEYGPGSNVLHYVVQTASNGGDNLLSDAHYVAQYMKENYPQQYKMLTDVEVEWSHVGVEHGSEFFKLNRAPVIQLNLSGEISRIHFSVSKRSDHFPGPIESVVPWYEAYTLFLKLNHIFSVTFKTNSGDMLVFDNTRLLHSRNAYEDKDNNVRKIVGAYMDWDEIYSRLRCLTVKMKNEDKM